MNKISNHEPSIKVSKTINQNLIYNLNFKTLNFLRKEIKGS